MDPSRHTPRYVADAFQAKTGPPLMRRALQPLAYAMSPLAQSIVSTLNLLLLFAPLSSPAKIASPMLEPRDHQLYQRDLRKITSSPD
jgi:hypothetical protein